MPIELNRENIEYEQLLGENAADSVIKNEYIIPDTLPDVISILMLDSKPLITNIEIIQNKVYLEGQVEYNVIYLAKEEEKYVVNNVINVGKFTNQVEIDGADSDMRAEAECYVEHMDCIIVNERKIAIEGIIKVKADIYKNYNFEIVRDIAGEIDVQSLKTPISVDKVIGIIQGELTPKYHMVVSNDKPQIGSILKCDVNVHKKEVKILNGKIQPEAFAHVDILYKAKDSRDLVHIDNDIYVNQEIEAENINSNMNSYSSFKVENIQYDVKEDDLGENRIIDVEALVKSTTMIINKEELNVIEDAYSPSILMNMVKKNYDLNVIHGQGETEAIVKGNIEIANGTPKPLEVLMSIGNVAITDKKLVEDKAVIEGILNATVIYRTFDEEKYTYTVNEEIPFTSSVDIKDAKIDMQSVAKVSLETIEASIEANTIAIKAIVGVYARVNYVTHREFVVDVSQIEGELPIKKSSITIYVVQASDTLWKIAKKYYTTLDSLVKVNELEDAETIKVGQKLLIPGRMII